MNLVGRAAVVLCACAFASSSTAAARQPSRSWEGQRVATTPDIQGFPLRYRLAVGGAGPPHSAPDLRALAPSPDGGFFAIGAPTGKSYKSPDRWVYRHDPDGRHVGSWRSQATDVAVAPDGSVWLTEESPIRLAHYAASGGFLGGTTDTAIFGRNEDGTLCTARLVTVGASGSVHVLTDCIGLLRFEPDELAGPMVTPMDNPTRIRDIVAGPDTRLYAAVSGTIEVYDQHGALERRWPGGEGDVPGMFGKICLRADPYCLEYDVGPTKIELTPDGLIAANDPGNKRIQRFTTHGVTSGQVPCWVSSFAWLTNDTVAHAKWHLHACDIDGTEIGYVSSRTSPREFAFAGSLDVSHDESLLVAAPYGLIALTSDGRAREWFKAVNWGRHGNRRWRGFAHDIDGTLLVATDEEVARFTVDGVHLGSWRPVVGGQPVEPTGICVTSSGTVFVGDYERAALHGFTSDGAHRRSWEASAWGVESIGQFVLDCGPDGSVLLLDTDRKRVLVLDPSGSAAAHWDGSSSRIGRLVRPVSIAGAPDGSVVVLDKDHRSGRLLRFSPQGEFVMTLLDQSELPDTYQPQHVSVGPSGTVYFPNRDGAIRRATLDGRMLEDLSFPSPGYGSFGQPGAVTRGAGGTVWIADSGQVRVQRVGPSGELLETWAATERGETRSVSGDIAAAPDGRLWIADPYSDELSLHDENGAQIVVSGGSLPDDLQLMHVAAVDVSGDDEIVAADTGAGRIVRFGSDGSVLSVIPAEWSRTDLHKPAKVAALAHTRDDVLLVLDAGSCIRRYERDGTPLSTWKLRDRVPDLFNAPSLLSIAPNDRIFVGDTVDNRVIELDPSGGFVRAWVVPSDWPMVALAASEDQVYVISREPQTGDRVLVYSVHGTLTGAWSLGRWRDPPIRSTGVHIEVDASDDLRVVEWPTPTWGPGVTRYRPDGTFLDHIALDVVTGSSGRATRARYAIEPDRTYMACDQSGTYGRNGVVYGFSRDGSLDTAWRDVVEPRGHLWGPTGVAVGWDGAGSYEVFVSNTSLGRIEVFAPDGRHKRTLGSEGSGPGQFRRPMRLEVVPDGTLLVADNLNRRVQRITPFGDVVDMWTGYGDPTAVAAGPRGEAYVLDGRRIQARSPSGDVLGWLDATELRQGELEAPADIAVADDGTLWITDGAERRVVAFAAEPLPTWQVSYYRDASWTDGPVHITTADAIDFDWGYGSPAPFVPANGFAVRFERILPRSGSYAWNLEVSGEASFVPGTGKLATVVSGSPASTPIEASILGGSSRVVLAFVDTAGPASVRLEPAGYRSWPYSRLLPAVETGLRHH